MSAAMASRLRRVSSRVSPLLADDVDTFRVITSADRRWAASSKVVRVRVEFSKNTLHTVLPRSNGTFFTARAPTSRNESAPKSSPVATTSAFTDPMADGPAIQLANIRALGAKQNLAKTRCPGFEVFGAMDEVNGFF